MWSHKHSLLGSVIHYEGSNMDSFLLLKPVVLKEQVREEIDIQTFFSETNDSKNEPKEGIE
jgi:hypothetical protein